MSCQHLDFLIDGFASTYPMDILTSLPIHLLAQLFPFTVVPFKNFHNLSNIFRVVNNFFVTFCNKRRGKPADDTDKHGWEEEKWRERTRCVRSRHILSA